MLVSIAMIILFGLLAGYIFKKMKLPSLVGMILVGIIMSPYAFNLIDASILNISSEIRRIALVIILTRAGLSLNIEDLKRVGRPAILMCFVPACFEIMGTIIFAPLLFDITILEAAIMGSVIAAVSPAVIVPRMIQIMEKGYGTHRSIPQMILAGTSVDDVFVIVLFYAFSGLEAMQTISFTSFLDIPLSITLGILLGILGGFIMSQYFKIFQMKETIQVLILLSISFLFLHIETSLEDIVAISGLLAIMSMGITIRQKDRSLATSLAQKYNQLWMGAEIFLFVLVGATVDLNYLTTNALSGALLIVAALVFRMLGVSLSLIKTPLNKKERLFCMLAYTPKATVQAAIGSIPLMMGLNCGSLVLMMAVLSILITAPFGAIMVDNTYEKLLTKE